MYLSETYTPQTNSHVVSQTGNVLCGKSGFGGLGGGTNCATKRGRCGCEISATTTPSVYQEK